MVLKPRTIGVLLAASHAFTPRPIIFYRCPVNFKYTICSAFSPFRPASLQMSDEPDLLHFDVESTNPWPIRENLRTFPTFLPSFLARVRISCFRKTTFTSSPFPCNLLMLSELWVKASFSFVRFQLSDL